MHQSARNEMYHVVTILTLRWKFSLPDTFSGLLTRMTFVDPNWKIELFYKCLRVYMLNVMCKCEHLWHWLVRESKRLCLGKCLYSYKVTIQYWKCLSCLIMLSYFEEKKCGPGCDVHWWCILEDSEKAYFSYKASKTLVRFRYPDENNGNTQ